MHSTDSAQAKVPIDEVIQDTGGVSSKFFCSVSYLTTKHFNLKGHATVAEMEAIRRCAALLERIAKKEIEVEF